MPTEPRPGEVWFAELGLVEKSRPVLVLAYLQPSELTHRSGRLPSAGSCISDNAAFYGWGSS